MEYKAFEENLIRELRKQSGGMFSVSVTEILKNNDVKRRALVLKSKTGGVCPTIYPEEIFPGVRNSMDVPHIAKKIIGTCLRCRAEEMNFAEDFFQNYPSLSSRIFCHLINRKKNEERLSRMPYESWEDLAVTYYYQGEGKMTDYHVQICYDHLRHWGIDEVQLRQDAWKNTLEKKPACLHRLSDILKNSLEYSGDADLPDSSLLVLSNKEGVDGAVAIAYPHQVDVIRAGLDGGFYMIPCSIHECLILPDNGGYDREELNRMVREVNRTEISPGDILSDHVYRF